ncbi:MAG: hypothetical protein K6F00_04380 [Lachnospiraceae bacterium]|nr:hypothetical protein [Lachnospiraceae bacterium]
MKKILLSFVKRTGAFALAASLFMTAVPVSAADMEEEGIAVDDYFDDDYDDEPAIEDESAEEGDAARDAFVHSEWAEQSVSGSEAPTLEAQSPQEFSKNYDAGVDAEDGLYSLTISTGVKAGTEGVRYIVVKYTDVNGCAQSKYILMTDDPLGASMDYIKAQGTVNQELTDRHQKLDSLNYKISEPSASVPLAAWSDQEFLFKTESEIKTVDDVHVFMRGGTSWTVQGLVVSKVTKIAGFGEYGYYSGRYFSGITKKPICRLKSKKSGSLTLSPPSGADQRYKLAGGSSSYFELEQTEDAGETTSPFNDIYTIRMDFADTLEGGIESYLRNEVTEGKNVPSNFCEHLALEIEYKDSNDWVKSVTLPVMLSVYGQYLNSEDTVRTIGLGQRGETVAFTGCLPGFKSMVSTKLYVGKAARDKLSKEGGIVAKKTSMENELDSDRISLAGVSLYKGTCRISNTEDGTDIITNEKLTSYTTAYSFSESSPFLYYANTEKGGVILTANSSMKLKLRSYKQGDPIIASKNTNNAIIRLKTADTTKKAGTTGSVKVRVDYTDESGKNHKSSYIDAKSQSNDYMGYWPSENGKKGCFAYDYGMSSGKYIEFWTELSGIVSVSNIDISLSETNDEYVLGGLCLLVAEKFGRRRIYRQHVAGNNNSSDFRIVRDTTSAELDGFPVDLTTPAVFGSGEVLNYTIGGGDNGGGIRFSDTDIYPEMRYTMSYEQTKQNLGFAKSRITYEVGVKVADNSESHSEDGDSGSVNKFYFQLQFKNGNSAFVLANQQMSSDGFRAGFTEIFNISVNHNYGDLKNVRIIPEDTQSDNAVFDKLNIEYITVTENNGGGAATQYVIDRVGWIGIDYHDEAEAASIRGRSGRTVGELASRFDVSYQRKVVSLLCEITNLPSEIQPEASVACELTYVDTNGSPQTTTFDVVRRMADYMKKPAKSYEGATSGEDASYYQNMTSISDPQWMLRPGHTDRFILPAIVNLKSVKSMKLIAVNRGAGTAMWNIGGVTLSEIIADGPLTITSDDEYLRNMNTAPLCINVASKEKETFTLTAGTAQSLDLVFSENEIVYKVDETWATPVARLPEGAGDTMNVYVYPSDTARNIDNVNITIAAQYTTAFSGAMQVSDSGLRKYGSGTEEAVFYSTGLNAEGMERLISLGIKCVSNTQTFDHAIVQHIRDNVVIANYYVPLLGAIAKIGLTGKPYSTTEMISDKKIQQLSISFAPDTEEVSLLAAERDVAVSFKYRSTLDRGQSEYYSPYVYLTDEQYTKLRGGLMAELSYEIPFVSEITGYRIGCFGDIKAHVLGAQMVTYSYDDRTVDEETGQQIYNNKTREWIYSFNQDYSISNAVEDYKVTGDGYSGDDTVNLIDLSFKTLDATASHESGTNDPVEMVFYYRNSAGGFQYMRFDDIRPFIQAENRKFSTGSLAEIKLFLPECEEMIAILIIPYNGSGMSTWSIESVSGFMSLGDRELNRAVNKQFTELTKETVIFVDGYDLPDVSITGNGQSITRNTLKITTFDYGPSDGKRSNGTVSDHKASIELKQGETAKFYPAFEGGGGYIATAMILTSYKDSNTGAVKTGFVETDCLIESNGVLTFRPKTSDDVQTYKVIITSTRDSSLVDIIDITVSGKEPEQTQEEDETGNPVNDVENAETETPVNNGEEVEK